MTHIQSYNLIFTCHKILISEQHQSTYLLSQIKPGGGGDFRKEREDSQICKTGNPKLSTNSNTGALISP